MIMIVFDRRAEMESFMPQHAAVWFEIPVTDMARAKKFYAAVTGNELRDQEGGPNPMSVFRCAAEPGVSGHIYPGKPAAGGSGPTIHLAVAAPLEDAMQRVKDNGGKVLSPAIEIPAGRFAYCTDPDGNSFGIFT